MQSTPDHLTKGDLYNALRRMIEANRSWADAQTYFRRNCEVCTDGGYFACIMLLWRNYGDPRRLRFFRKALCGRDWNPLLIMGPIEYAEYQGLPALVHGVSTKPGVAGWLEFDFDIRERNYPPTCYGSGAAKPIEIPKREVFAVRIDGGHRSLMVLGVRRPDLRQLIGRASMERGAESTGA